MNILITTDDGLNAYGLVLLREAVKRHFKEAKQIVMATKEPQMGQGMSVSALPAHQLVPYEEVEPNVFIFDGKPCDVVYMAFTRPELFLPTGTFDLVYSGVNHGANIGLDVYHSGTVGVVMMASSIFGAGAMALSQELDVYQSFDRDKDGPTIYANTARLLDECIRLHPIQQGDCLNVNFPKVPAKGWRPTGVAPYSRWRKIPGLPVHENLNDDIQWLTKGFVTVSELELRVTPAMRY